MTAKIPENPFVLVDGSSYLFRAYHALPPLTTVKGQPTGAIYGVVNMLRRLMKDYKPEKIAVVFDSKEKNFRHQLYAEYKANRMVMPDELQCQIEPLYKLIRAMGLPLILMPGVEADDIIGSLAKEAKAHGLFTLISTGDKDFAQLVDQDIILINTMSADILDRARVIEKFGLPPEKIIDYLALIGDSVDNIPGIPKVGPKTGVKWMETYGSLDKIIASAGEIPGKVGENLRDNVDKLPLYRNLVTIDVNLKIELHPKDLGLQKPDTETLKRLYQELEFKSWLKELSEKELTEKSPMAAPNSEESGVQASDSDSDSNSVSEQESLQPCEIVLNAQQIKSWLSKIKQAGLFSFNLQTTEANYMAAKILGLALALESGHSAYLPLQDPTQASSEHFLPDTILQEFKSIFEDAQIIKIGHHVKYALEVLSNYGIHLKGQYQDTMLESYVLDSAGSRHELAVLALKHLDYRMMDYESLVGKGAKQCSFSEIPLGTAARCATEMAAVTLNLHRSLASQLAKESSLKKVYETIELPLLSVLASMEMGGVLIDSALLQKQSQELASRLETIEQETYTLAGKTFNLGSPKQLQEILFVDLNLPVLEKTPTGQPSTSESVLQTLAEQYELPKFILEYRTLSKLKSTYTDKLPELIDPNTKRLHTSYHQAVTSTGRLSSSNPNLQNIPIRSPEGRKIRAAFVAPPGFKILSIDYSQVELRIMAHMSEDQGLVSAFSKDDDIHRSTAAAIFGIPLAAVTAEQRRSSKAINFGLMYGMSSFGVAKQLGIDQKEAEKHMKHYFECFPKVKYFMEKIKQQALELGYVETLFGRRLYLPDLKSKNHILRKAAERAAINAPMQGTNADIIKLAMIELDQWIKESKLDIKMIMQVHDELVFEVPDNQVDLAKEKIRDVMENVVPLSVKLLIGMGIGNNWDEAHGLA